MDGWRVGWMDGFDGELGGWMDGLMEGWVD